MGLFGATGKIWKIWKEDRCEIIYGAPTTLQGGGIKYNRISLFIAV